MKIADLKRELREKASKANDVDQVRISGGTVTVPK